MNAFADEGGDAPTRSAPRVRSLRCGYQFGVPRHEPPVPDETEAEDPRDRVPGEQGGTPPEHYGGVDSGEDAVEGGPDRGSGRRRGEGD